ncbi:hypothetical protein BDB13_0875 [Rhodococcus sp. OK302]|nr:hypothetical protein BDB13_0875 [Rhodococcus sp. OK302]
MPKVRILLVPLLAVAGVAWACTAYPYLTETVSFTPPDATVLEKADCSGSEVLEQLAGVEFSSVEQATWKPGYPPRSFDPVALVRCELGEDSSGATTLDTVRLEGNLAAVKDDFRVDSKRFPDNVQADCAIRELAPARLWLVNNSGLVILPAWPLRPCGLQDGPLESIQALREVGREQVPVVLNPPGSPGVCRAVSETFEARTVDDVERDTTRVEDAHAKFGSAIATPRDDVGRLNICRHEGSDGVFESAVRLTQNESSDFTRMLATAPVAPPCDMKANRMASTTLMRADGSGGTSVTLELDGCRRMRIGSVFRSVPESATAILSK